MRDLEEHNAYVLAKIVDPNWSTSYKSHPKDLTGMTFNDLHVDEFIGHDERNKGYYKCTCKCGKITYVRGDALVGGKVKSCGCRHQKHGASETRLFGMWLGMIQRCTNPNSPKYHRYGGRGIKVCDEWLKGDNPFVVFREWAYNNGYSDYYEEHRKAYISIGRIDNDYDYCPENCTFETNDDQAINKSYTIYLRYDIYVFAISIWAKIMGLNRNLLQGRFNKGWSTYDILTIPPENSNRNHKKYNGKRLYIQVPAEYWKYNKYNEFVRKGIIDESDPDIYKMSCNQLKDHEKEVFKNA